MDFNKLLHNPVFLSTVYAITTVSIGFLTPYSKDSFFAAATVAIFNLIDAWINRNQVPPQIERKITPPANTASIPVFDTGIYGNFQGIPVVVDIDNVAFLTMGDGGRINNAPLGSTVFKTDKNWYGVVTNLNPPITFTKINPLLSDLPYLS